MIVLDQFSRNIYRGTAKSFAFDARARAVAHEAIERGDEADLDDDERGFLYMPFMHSEGIEDQERCIALFEAMGAANQVKYAKAHRDIVARFGRFPHRNGILGRASTEEEQEFLKQPGSGF